MNAFTIADYLLVRLKELGIRHIFGVPGDYNLEFLDRIEQTEDLEWVGNCNELNAAYAADGYARINGVGALATTFGPGELSAMCGMAGAYAESVPVIEITGSPSTAAQDAGSLMHHTLGNGEFGDFQRMHERVTVARADLRPGTADLEIDRVLSACVVGRRPVHINLPSDVAMLPAAPPLHRLACGEPHSKPAMLSEALNAMVDMLDNARHPVILADVLIARHRLEEDLRRLLAASGYPVATLNTGRGVVDESHPQYIGVYLGTIGHDDVRQRMEDADCVLSLGAVMSDIASCGFTCNLDPGKVIDVSPTQVRVRRAVYANVYMRDVLSGLARRLKRRSIDTMDIRPASQTTDLEFRTPFRAARSDVIRQQRFWHRFGRFLRDGDMLLADQGTPYFGMATTPLPPHTTLVAQGLWVSIGYTVPALLGCMLAAPQRRAVLAVGDGAFQMTAQEISTILRRRLAPVIFLLNNNGYSVERAIHGPEATYNDIQPWDYIRLLRTFGQTHWAVRVGNEGELEEAIHTADRITDRLTLIEVLLDKLDFPESLNTMGQVFAAQDRY